MTRRCAHRGTLGGTLAHSDPASDLPAAVLALGGTIVARGPSGDREIAATDFFTGYFESALADDEMIVEVRVAASAGGWNYQKFNRRAQDWAIVGVAVADSGAGVSLVNMGSTPLRASAVEAAVAAGASAADAAAVAADGLQPPTDSQRRCRLPPSSGTGLHRTGPQGRRCRLEAERIDSEHGSDRARLWPERPARGPVARERSEQERKTTEGERLGRLSRSVGRV